MGFRPAKGGNRAYADIRLTGRRRPTALPPGGLVPPHNLSIGSALPR